MKRVRKNEILTACGSRPQNDPKGQLRHPQNTKKRLWNKPLNDKGSAVVIQSEAKPSVGTFFLNSPMYYVYILTNKLNTVLYTGITNNLVRRLWEHRNGLNDGFTKKYNVHKLVFYECFSSVKDAIAREKQIKGKSRAGKILLIDEMNPEWKELSDFE